VDHSPYRLDNYLYLGKCDDTHFVMFQHSERGP
jgi:hypothetical protein